MPHPELQPCLFETLPHVPPPRSSVEEYVAQKARKENAERMEAHTRERIEQAGKRATL